MIELARVTGGTGACPTRWGRTSPRSSRPVTVSGRSPAPSSIPPSRSTGRGWWTGWPPAATCGCCPTTNGRLPGRGRRFRRHPGGADHDALQHPAVHRHGGQLTGPHPGSRPISAARLAREDLGRDLLPRLRRSAHCSQSSGSAPTSRRGSNRGIDRSPEAEPTDRGDDHLF